MSSSLPCVRPNAAGIDIGSRSHFVCVPTGRDPKPVREFTLFTEDLYKLADWLRSCKIDSVAFESTGNFWFPLYDVLKEQGFEVFVVNPHHVKSINGKKTDVLDCQWIQQLHSMDLLRPSFIPDDLTKKIRFLTRQRTNLIRISARQLSYAQDCLRDMNIQLQNVVSDLSGETGMAILRDIVAGERDPKKLAKHRDPRCKSDEKTIEKSLTVHYKPEVVFALKQALETYDHYKRQIAQYNQEIEALLEQYTDKSEGKSVPKKKENIEKTI